MHQKSIQKPCHGQTIVEAVVVIGIVVLLATGLIAGTTASLKTARAGKTRSQAVKYAQEGLEQMRALRDLSWTTFSGYSGTYCYGSDFVLIPPSPSCPPNITTSDGEFTRSITLAWNDPRMTVTSRVSYVDGELARTVDLVTYMTKWK